jgi:hypothetical protein
MYYVYMENTATIFEHLILNIIYTLYKYFHST